MRQLSWRQRLFIPTMAAYVRAGPEARRAPASWPADYDSAPTNADRSHSNFGNRQANNLSVLFFAPLPALSRKPKGLGRGNVSRCLGGKARKGRKESEGGTCTSNMTQVLQVGGAHCRAGVLPAPAPCAGFALSAAHLRAAAELQSCRARGGAALRSRRCVEGRDRNAETIRKSCRGCLPLRLTCKSMHLSRFSAGCRYVMTEPGPAPAVSDHALSGSVPHTLAPRCRLSARRAKRQHAIPAVLAQAGQKFDYDLVIIGCGVGGHGAALHAVECVRPQGPAQQTPDGTICIRHWE